MKKIVYALFISSICLMLVSCSNKRGLEEEEVIKEEEVSTEIDKQLVQQLANNWIGEAEGNYPELAKSDIVEKEGYLFFDNKKLKIISATGNEIFTETEEEKPWHYVFEIEDDQLTVYPSYTVPEGMSGGALAPMTFTRDTGEEMAISTLFGEWQSVEEPGVYYMSIREASDGLINYADNLEQKDSQMLKIEKISNDSILALTEDESSFYQFIFSDKNEITAFMGVNSDYFAKKGEEIPDGMSKPIKYKRIIKE